MNYIYSVIPVIIILVIIDLNDKNKEPVKLLMELFLGGIVSTFIVLVITRLLRLIYPDITIINNEISNVKLFINILITIGLTEEISKWLITYFLSYNNKEFDELFDIIVYSVFVSLGFATLENILYVTESAQAATTALIRGFLSIPSHAALGIIMGSFLGLAKIEEIKNNHKQKRKYLIYSVLIPVELHTIFDFCSISSNVKISMFFYPFILILFFFATIIIIQFTSKNTKIKQKRL